MFIIYLMLQLDKDTVLENGIMMIKNITHIQETYKTIHVPEESGKFFYIILKQIINLLQFFVLLLECVFFKISIYKQLLLNAL